MKRIVLACLAVALLLAPSPAGAEPGDRKTYAKTHPFGPDRESKVGIRQGPVTIESVRIRNWPDADDFADAEKDLGETHTMVVEFEYSNRDEARDWKCRYTVTITGKDGSRLGRERPDRHARLGEDRRHEQDVREDEDPLLQAGPLVQGQVRDLAD